MPSKNIQMKCGIEIHQQLEGEKLFCSCPTLLRDDQPHFTIQRKIRASAGEAGEFDVAAVQEQAKDKTFVYEGYHDTTCLVETDSEPPHEVNSAALYTALQFTKLVNATVPDVVQVMRKTVVDGSNTSGFQRTALIGRNGMLQTKGGQVSITNISLEEDSCKIINDSPDTKTYRLDRLGVPLIEIGTGPDITSPEQCQETAKSLGMLLRSLPGVKRGLGTIRQDVNISINGGNRVEIKGAQDLRQLPLLAEYEVKRQEALLTLRPSFQTLFKTTTNTDSSLRHLFLHQSNAKLVKDIFQHTKCNFIKKALYDKREDFNVLALRLVGLKGIIGKELQPGKRVGTDISDFIKIKTGVSGLIHSDEDLKNKYAFEENEIRAVEERLNLKKEDTFLLVLVKGTGNYVLDAIAERFEQLSMGVPKEVRKANEDATTSFLRAMPGAARMYPETDVPLIFPDLKAIKVPELLTEKMTRYQQKFGLGADLAEFVAKSDRVLLFEEMVTKYPNIKPAFIADVLVSLPVEILRKYSLDPELLTEEQLREFFRALAQDQIHKDIAIDVLIDMIKGTYHLDRYARMGTENIHQIIKEVVEKNKSAPFSALMGLCMKELAGKASGQFISEQLKKLLEQGHK